MEDSKKQKADKRRQKKYGITPEQYHQISKDGCGMCGWKPKEGQRSLAVDHFHFKVLVSRITPVFYAPKGNWMKWYAVVKTPYATAYGRTKKEAVTEVKEKAMPFSVRGALCVKCNRLLRYDVTPKLLRRAAEYLEKFLDSRSNFV